MKKKLQPKQVKGTRVSENITDGGMSFMTKNREEEEEDDDDNDGEARIATVVSKHKDEDSY
jgi:hypothetical protein